MDLFENAAVVMLSCGRVKTELFENADVTASIYDVPEHAHGSSVITQGHFDFLFSFVKIRTEGSLKVAASSCGRGYFFIRIKKDAFSKISGYVWTGPQYKDLS